MPSRPARGAVVASLLVVTAIAAPSSGWRRHDGTNLRPNIVLVSMDTLRADHLGVYGYSRPTSPCLDRLAASSTVFEHAFSHATWTLPSHMSLFTSLQPSEHGVVRRKFRLRDEHRTLAEVLREAGYRTAAFTAGTNVSKRYGFDRGFDVYAEEYPRDGWGISGKGWTLREVLPTAFAWMAANAAHAQFVFLHAFDVHEPYVAHRHFGAFDTGYDGPLRELADPATFRGGELHRRYGDGKPALNAADFLGRLNEGDVEVSARDRAFIVALYDNEIRAADHMICRLLGALRRLGLARRTIVVVTSDHGQELFERGGIQHGGPPYEEQIRVPLIVHVPREPARRSAKLARHIDVAPSLLALAGMPAEPSFRGMSLFPLEAPGPQTVVSEGGRARSIRTKSRKLLVTGRGHRLYDVANDPGERHDIAAREPATVSRLSVELAQTVRRSGSRSPKPKPPPLTDRQREQLRALGYAE